MDLNKQYGGRVRKYMQKIVNTLNESLPAPTKFKDAMLQCEQSFPKMESSFKKFTGRSLRELGITKTSLFHTPRVRFITNQTHEKYFNNILSSCWVETNLDPAHIFFNWDSFQKYEIGVFRLCYNHELTHLFHFFSLGEKFNNIPKWILEGCTEYFNMTVAPDPTFEKNIYKYEVRSIQLLQKMMDKNMKKEFWNSFFCEDFKSLSNRIEYVLGSEPTQTLLSLNDPKQIHFYLSTLRC